MRDLDRKIAAALTATLLFSLLIARQIGESRTFNDFYQVTEWRIFYPGRFIRRGLRGSSIDWLSHSVAISPELLIRIVCTLSYALLTAIATAYLFKWLWDKASSWILILLLSPVGLFFYLNAIMSIGRFDVFFVLLTICHLEICIRAKDVRTYFVYATALFLTLGTASVLCHEAFVLLCLPANVMLSWRRLGKWDFRVVLIYGAPGLATSLCLLNPVTSADVATLSNAFGIPIGTPQWYGSPLCLFGLSLPGQAAEVRSLLSISSVWPTFLTLGCFGAIHYAALRRLTLASTVSERVAHWLPAQFIWRDLFLVPLLCTLPLYVVGADYGRWFAITVTTFTVCCSRFLEITLPVRRIAIKWRMAALLVFVFIPIPLSLRLPNQGSQLLSWTGAAILGHFYGNLSPANAVRPQPFSPGLTNDFPRS